MDRLAQATVQVVRDSSDGFYGFAVPTATANP